MVNLPLLMRRFLVATSLAAALAMTQASASEGVVVAGEPGAPDAVVAVPAETAGVATPASGSAAVAALRETPHPASSATATGAGLSTFQAMASTTYPAVKRHRTATRPPYRAVASGGYDGRGSDAWYGRHFVLMLGVAY